LRTVYGPVPSWRLGRSLGIDLISSSGKVCQFDCSYCQLGGTVHHSSERREFVPTETVCRELWDVLSKVEPDVITFSGTGEPTLALNLRGIIHRVKEMTSVPLAMLTNSYLINDRDTIASLKELDIVVAKLDAPNPAVFETMNAPVPGVTLDEMVKGLKHFQSVFPGKLRFSSTPP